MKNQLDQETHQSIQVLSKEGDELAKDGEYSEARAKYIEALKLLPEDRENWEAST